MVILLILIIGTATGYDLKCPAKSEWRLRGNISCSSVDKYVCLLHILENRNMENCSGSDRSSIGSRLVFQPLFNLAECNAGRFQPIVFTTHGNSECIFSKSKCYEEGQVVFSNSSSSSDAACRCDYTKGYAFVTKPKNSCFCKPSEEDCSCLKVTCTKLSPDYQCLTDGEIMMNTSCQDILPSISYNKDNITVPFIESNKKNYSSAQHVVCITFVSIAVYFVFAVIVLLKVVVFVPPEILSQEIIASDGNNIRLKCYVKSYLPLSSGEELGDSVLIDIKYDNAFICNGIRILTFEMQEKDDFATYKCKASNIVGSVESDPIQSNDDISTDGNETTVDERQNIIHELFLKGGSGKLHFARLVFIEKKRVGKTSLMRRLLWQKKEDVTSTQSTDGIEVEKCNISIADGKWSPCNKIDDDQTRLIHQVFKKKSLDVEFAAAKTVVVQKHFSSNTDESRSVSDKELSKSSDERDDIDDLSDDPDGESYNNDDVEEAVISNTDIHAIISNKRDNNLAVETNSNQTQPDKLVSKNQFDDQMNSVTNENEYDPVDNEKINKMTSTIMKTYFQLKEEEKDHMLAFCRLWDFASQKDFYATHQVFRSKYAVYVLVTDSLELSTAENQGIDFEDSAQYVSFWFDAIQCYLSTTNKGRLDPPVIVVCTNEDTIKEPLEQEKRQKQFKKKLRQVLKNQAKIGHLRNIYFIYNTENTDIVFEAIRKEISREAVDMQDWNKDCPLKWLLFQQVLLKLKDGNVPISSTKTLLKIAKHTDINISEDHEVKQCLQYCHDIGIVVYFDEENLADYVILDPNWLINAFRCFFSDTIENVIEVSDDRQQLTNTGLLTDALISRLFSKEPELKFEDYKVHLIEVMKRFDFIVNLRNSTAFYMPCMIKPCSLSEVQRQFCDGSQSFYKTSWICLEFKFLPPGFFNHIIAWYIKQYQVSVITDKGFRSKTNALYRQVGVFDLDPSSSERLVVCEGPNTVALQVWNSRVSNTTYGGLVSELIRFVESVRKRYNLHISYTNTFTCKDGDVTINRQTIESLVPIYYRCLEHNTDHLSGELIQPWNVTLNVRNRRMLKRLNEVTMAVKGDSGVGKTSLLISYTSNVFSIEYVPTLFKTYTAKGTVNGTSHTIGLFDAGGQKDSERLSSILYPYTNVVLLCFSINDRSSFINIEKKWIPEAQTFLPGVAQVLVGCKADLRDSNEETCITESEAETFASDHSLPYCETSARTQKGIQLCFQKAIIDSW